MAAACCPPGSLPAVAADKSHTPQGEWRDVSGINTYVTACPCLQGRKEREGEGLCNSSNCILVFHDIFGVTSGRTVVICDALATRLHCHVVLPDFFHGSPPLNPALDTQTFWGKLWAAPQFIYSMLILRSRHRWESVCTDIAEKVMPYLVDEMHVSAVGVHGFCWGSWPVAHICSTAFGEHRTGEGGKEKDAEGEGSSDAPQVGEGDNQILYPLPLPLPEGLKVCEGAEGIVKCGAAAHPSYRLFGLMGEDRDKVVSAISVPQLLMPASNDEPDLMEGGAVEKIWKSKWCGERSKTCTYRDMVHGWMNRGDLKDPLTAERAQQAEDTLVQFFAENMPSS